MITIRKGGTLPYEERMAERGRGLAAGLDRLVADPGEGMRSGAGAAPHAGSMDRSSEATAASGNEAKLFRVIREGVIGQSCVIETPYGQKCMIYADWSASGRLYAPIEKRMVERFGPYVANTHTESNVTGATMSRAYGEALRMIKRHVNADSRDVVLTAGSGMTDVVNKLQRMLGLRVPDGIRRRLSIPERDRPVIFLTHMEHHSNHISWIETIGDTVILPPNREGQADPEILKEMLKRYRDRPLKIGAFTACSNVTGIETPYRQLARVMHEHGGVCFIDFTASAPYIDMDMHPAHPLEKLDAIYFSPHKFLGGPGTCGVLVFDRRLYRSRVPDHPGGGTVFWTDPWGRIKYWDGVEAREDGGTPGFLQAIRTALCIRLKDQLGTERMARRKEELLRKLWRRLSAVPGVHILEPRQTKRLGTISFWMETVPYQLAVRLMNDVYGIQVRGGCSCAGTYGHYLFGIGKEASDAILQKVEAGDYTGKPGWVRISLHPVMEDAEVEAIADAVEGIARGAGEWEKEYEYDPASHEYRHRRACGPVLKESWFDMSDPAS